MIDVEQMVIRRNDQRNRSHRGFCDDARVIDFRFGKEPPTDDGQGKSPSESQLNTGQRKNLDVPACDLNQGEFGKSFFLGVSVAVEEIEFSDHGRRDDQRVTFALVDFAEVVGEVLTVGEIKQNVCVQR